MSGNTPEAALEALRALPGVLDLVAVNIRHAKDVENSHGGQDRLLDSQAKKIEDLNVEIRDMARFIAPVIEETK